jgi:tryptophan-rich sensory protein
MTEIHWGLLVVSILVCQAAGLLGLPFTVKSIPTWFKTLRKPSFEPPSWIFGPMWTLLYTLMGISLYLVWVLPESTPGRGLALGIFAVQWFLNALWSPVFFGWKKSWVAFGVIVPMSAAIIATIVCFSGLDATAAWLLVPYALWVFFAAALNFAIARLNPKGE